MANPAELATLAHVNDRNQLAHTLAPIAPVSGKQRVTQLATPAPIKAVHTLAPSELRG